MKSYLLRLICAAIVCALVRAMAGEGQGLRKLACGAFLVLTALSIPMKPELPDLDLNNIFREAETAVREGTAQAESSRGAIIKEALEAYIWNKAAALELAVTVRVELQEDESPGSVVLTGHGPARARRELTQTLIRELGLGEEDVVWIEPHQSSE